MDSTTFLTPDYFIINECLKSCIIALDLPDFAFNLSETLEEPADGGK
jgi:hypothetical protein